LESGQIKVEKVSPFMLRWLIVVVISKRRIIAEVMISPA
jgi:hypothetical protein